MTDISYERACKTNCFSSSNSAIDLSVLVDKYINILNNESVKLNVKLYTFFSNAYFNCIEVH